MEKVKPLDSVVYENFKGVVTVKTFTQCLTQLLMNSLDAGATAVSAQVSVRRGLVQVKDNGAGIAADSLRLVGERFATSRCRSASELQGQPRCYGYRGEGLHAVGAAVDSVVVVTLPRSAGAEAVTLRRRVNERGSPVLPERPARRGHGTTVAAFGLHERLLVGREHINAESEFEDMQRAMQEFMLMHPKVWFCFYNSDLDTQVLNHGRPRTVQNVLVCLHPDLEVDLCRVFRFHKKKYSIEALLYNKPYESDKAQYLYVNKRPVLSPEVEKFIVMQYQKRVFTTLGSEERGAGGSSKNKHPVYVVNMNLPQTDYELIFTEDNKCPVLFLYLDLILKHLEKIFNILVGHKPPRAIKPATKVPTECLSPFGFPLLTGAVSASVYKHKRKLSPHKTINPRRDNYAIEDDSRNEFVIPSTQVHDNKPGPSKRPTEQRRNKSKMVKRPLPICINTKLPLSESKQDTNSHQKLSTQAKKVKRNEQTTVMAPCCDEIIEPDKRAKIVSQKHADQMAHLVEDVNFESVPSEPGCKKGKVLIMEKFLKSMGLYEEESRSTDVSPKENKNQMQTDDVRSNSEVVARSFQNLDMTDEVNSNNVSTCTQLLDETAFEVKCKRKTDLACCETQTNSKETQNRPVQEKNEDFLFKLSENESTRLKLPRTVSNSSSGKKNIELASKNVTSKCVQTSMILEHETLNQVSMLETVDDINYNRSFFFQEHALPLRKQPHRKFSITNGVFQRIDQVPCAASRTKNINYQVEPNLFSMYEANCVMPKRKSLKKYFSNYDCNFSNLNDVPLLKCKNETQPYYFSYKDKTMKLFDCYENKSRNFQQTWQVCDDYSRPFQLIHNGNNLLPEPLFPSNTDRQEFPGRELNFEKQDCVQLQTKHHHMHSNGYETCLEDTDLSPIRKVALDSQKQQSLPLKGVNDLPFFKKKYTSNRQINTNMVKERYFQKVVPSFNKHIVFGNHLQKSNIPICKSSIHCTNKHDKNTFPGYYPHNKSKYFSPDFNQSRSKIAGAKDTFDLDKFIEMYPMDDRNKCKYITTETGNLNSEMFTAETKRLQFMENMIPDDPVLNASLKNESCTFLRNISPTSFHFSPKFKSTQLSFPRKQNEDVSPEKFTLNLQTSREEAVTSKMDRCLSLEVHAQQISHEPTLWSNINHTKNNSQTNMSTLIEKNKENCDGKSTANVPVGENFMPPTPLSENTFKIRAKDFLENSSPKEGAVDWKPTSTSEWTKILDQYGTTFYYNKRTGMTTFYSPKSENKFSLAPRSEFVPKGLSPVLVKWKSVDKTLSPQGKENLQRVIIESYENELLTVKWLDCGYQNDPKAFFDELYKEKAKLHQPPVPIANKSSLASIRFNKSIFRNAVIIGQVDLKFIAAVTNVTGHILLFDQHAVHERICLERLQKEYNKAGRILRQPVTIFLQNTDLIFVQNQVSYLTNLGLTFDFISNGITVRGIPLCLWRRILKEKENDMKHVAEIIQITIDQVLGIFKSEKSLVCPPPIIEDVIKMEACRGAIKFGQPLSKDTCQQLIEDLQGCALPFQCAHGRPTLQPLLQLNKTSDSLTKRSNK